MTDKIDMNDRAAVNDWERRNAEAWAEIDGYYAREAEAEFRERIDRLADELPAGHPVAPFERGGAWDSTGHSGKAVPLYREALESGLAGMRRRRAVVQMSSSLRNIGRVDEAIEWLTAELENHDPDAAVLNDAVAATLALCLVDVGRGREAVSLAVGALAPHLPRYQRSMANYARQLVAPADAQDA